MQYAGTTSWQISVARPQALAIGLYVRAAAGLTDAHSWLPPITPAVLAVRAGTEAAAPQWERWWDYAVTVVKEPWRPPEPILAEANRLRPPFDNLEGSPELSSHMSRHFMDAVRWCRCRPERARPRDGAEALLETHLVAEVERSLGRRAAPFRLRVTAVPVQGRTMWRLGPQHVLVTDGLLADVPAYRARLAVVVRSLL